MQNELAIITERDKTSLTRLINTMERKNFVIRKRDNLDKRANLIYLTNSGRKIFESTVPIMDKSIQNLQAGLSEKEIQQTIKILQKLQFNLSKLTTPCGTNQL
jgi:DNA-binding MarR family transcriptional regulator